MHDLLHSQAIYDSYAASDYYFVVSLPIGGCIYDSIFVMNLVSIFISIGYIIMQPMFMHLVVQL